MTKTLDQLKAQRAELDAQIAEAEVAEIAGGFKVGDKVVIEGVVDCIEVRDGWLPLYVKTEKEGIWLHPSELRHATPEPVKPEPYGWVNEYAGALYIYKTQADAESRVDKDNATRVAVPVYLAPQPPPDTVSREEYEAAVAALEKKYQDCYDDYEQLREQYDNQRSEAQPVDMDKWELQLYRLLGDYATEVINSVNAIPGEVCFSRQAVVAQSDVFAHVRKLYPQPQEPSITAEDAVAALVENYVSDAVMDCPDFPGIVNRIHDRNGAKYRITVERLRNDNHFVSPAPPAPASVAVAPKAPSVHTGKDTSQTASPQHNCADYLITDYHETGGSAPRHFTRERDGQKYRVWVGRANEAPGFAVAPKGVCEKLRNAIVRCALVCQDNGKGKASVGAAMEARDAALDIVRNCIVELPEADTRFVSDEDGTVYIHVSEAFGDVLIGDATEALQLAANAVKAAALLAAAEPKEGEFHAPESEGK